LVVLLVTAYVLVAAAQIFYGLTLEFDPMPGRLITDNVAAMIADRITRTFFPMLGITAVLTVLALMIVLPPSAVISFFVSRKTTKRLATLAATTRAMREGDYSARVTITGEDEVAQLQTDFNAMAQKLEQTLRDLEIERDTVSRLLQSHRELVASVSHELRTPVATVRTTLESILHKQTDMDALLQHDLAVMENETLRLQRLIDDLFTLSQIEIEKLTLDCQPTAVPPVVQQIVEAMAPLAWNAGRVEVVTELPGDLATICVDKIRLEQILVNLLRNAIQHTPPGGIVAVIGRLEAGAELEAVCLEVRDTGNGISADDLPHIWERFYRARDADTNGAGLGLALVKELTEAMGGSVSVESIRGKGSSFTIKFPIT
jgi:signal transduction histidine kinase